MTLGGWWKVGARTWSRRSVLTAAAGELRRSMAADPSARDVARRGLTIVTALLVVAAALLPLYADRGTVLLMQQALYLGLLALSLNLLVSTTGLVSFGHAMFFGLGAYAVAIPVAKLEWSSMTGLVIAPAIGAVAAFAIGFVVLRGRELYFALLTLGVGQLIWATAHGWQSLTGGTNGTTGVFPPAFISPFQHADRLYWFVFAIVAASTGVLYAITRSPFGDALRGIRDNRLRAEFVGLWVKRYELTAFVVAGAFGALAGALMVVGETQITSAQVDWNRSALALIVCLIGGTRYILGPIAGAVFYLFVFDYVLSKTILWDTVLGIVVLSVALTLSGGLAGMVEWLLATGAILVRRARGTTIQPHESAVAEEYEVVHLPAPPPVGRAADPAVALADRSGPSVLSVRAIGKSFGGLVALEDVSLDVKRGSIHAVIGPNGAGKTTFFNVITGLIAPDGGSILLDGKDVTARPPWRIVGRGVARSFQQANLFWALSALDNLTLAAAAARGETVRMFGKNSASTRQHARSLIELVGLGDFASVSAAELSHGDQRSLEFAAALAVDSHVILLDEPTAGLSPLETRLATRLIQEVARERGLTVLFVEHDMEVVFDIADWITVFHRGAVLAEGTPDEIRANTDVRRAYLGEPDHETEVPA